MILMIPINGLIARLMKQLQKEQMKNKVCSFFGDWNSSLNIAPFSLDISWLTRTGFTNETHRGNHQQYEEYKTICLGQRFHGKAQLRTK
jgi:hypothetical protein